MTDVSDLAPGYMLGGIHLEDYSTFSQSCFLGNLLSRCFDTAGLCIGIGQNNQSLVADLSAHGAVERSLLCNDSAVLSVREGIHYAVLFLFLSGQRRQGCHSDDLRLGNRLVISYKSAGKSRIHILIYRSGSAHIAGSLAGALAIFSRRLLLVLHGSIKAFLIYGKALLFQNLLGVIKRESISIVQTERILTGELLLACSGQCLFHLIQNLHALLIGLFKLFFLGTDNIDDKVLLFRQFRIAVLGILNYLHSQCRQEGSLNTQLSAVADCPADDAAEHIASAVIGRHDAVRDHEGHGTGMICADTHRDILIIAARLLVADSACQLTDQIPKRLQSIHVKNRTYVLHSHSQTL